MLKLKVLLVAALLAGLAAFAQDSSQTAAPATAPTPTRKHSDSAEKRLKRMSKRLKLTDDQKEKLKPILQDEEKQVSAVDGDSALTQQQRHKKMREIRLASRSQMDSILTEEQKAQMPKMRAGGGRRHRQNNGQTSGPAADTTTPQ